MIADGAYLGTGLIVPHRRRAGRPLLRGQEEDNADHRRVSARVEHTFARTKNWKILRAGLRNAVQVVTAQPRPGRMKPTAQTTPTCPHPPVCNNL